MPSRLPALSMLGFTSKTSPLCYEDKASLSVSRFTKLAVCVRWTSMLICQQRTAAPHPAGAHTHPAPDNLEADGSHLKRRPAERIARATLPYAARGRRRAAHRVLLRAGRTPGPREGFDGLLGFGFTFFWVLKGEKSIASAQEETTLTFQMRELVFLKAMLAYEQSSSSCSVRFAFHTFPYFSLHFTLSCQHSLPHSHPIISLLTSCSGFCSGAVYTSHLTVRAKVGSQQDWGTAPDAGNFYRQGISMQVHNCKQ